MESRKWLSTAEAVQQTLIMPMLCVVYSRSNWSNSETNMFFIRRPGLLFVKGKKKCKKPTEKRQKKLYPLTAVRMNRVCSDYFVKGDLPFLGFALCLCDISLSLAKSFFFFALLEPVPLCTSTTRVLWSTYICLGPFVDSSLLYLTFI